MLLVSFNGKINLIISNGLRKLGPGNFGWSSMDLLYECDTVNIVGMMAREADRCDYERMGER